MGVFRPLTALKMTTQQTSFEHEIEMPRGKNSLYESFYTSLGNCLGTLGAIPLCACFPNAYKTVEQGSVGLISKYGKFYKAVDPGLHYVTPIVEELKVVDIKIQVEDIPRWALYTRWSGPFGTVSNSRTSFPDKP